uniref:Uncharacterized protein n=1 Tax=Arundo donax TaxID=35708 RepID=A0A0A9CP23_ARUDO
MRSWGNTPRTAYPRQIGTGICSQACNSACSPAWLVASARAFRSGLALADRFIEFLRVGPFPASPPTLFGRDNRFLPGVFACTSLSFGLRTALEGTSVGWEQTSSKTSSETFIFCLDDPKEVEGRILAGRANEVQLTSEYDFLWFTPFFLLRLQGVFEIATFPFGVI